MSQVIEKVRNATRVMDGAAIAFASIKAKLKQAQEEAAKAGAAIPALDEAVSALDAEASELASAIAENTAAAASENPTPGAVIDVAPADTPPLTEPAA
jgi:chromosome segregation ATPase